MATTMFCELNGITLQVAEDDAVETMLGVATGEIDERALASWIRRHTTNTA